MLANRNFQHIDVWRAIPRKYKMQYRLFEPITTTTTKATTTARSLDGELLWQQEATEFIERFPQSRRQRRSQSNTLRPSASAGALHTKTPTAMTKISKRASGGELLTAQQRHQRDLFSGDLGIPEVRSHVGNMVHTFETIALQRKLADQKRAKERAWLLQQQQQWEREQLQERENSKYIMPALTSAIHTMTTYTTYDTPTHASYSYVSKHGTSNSKYHQLKRKSHESRQRLIQLSKQQLLAAFGSNKSEGKSSVKSGKRIEKSPKIIKTARASSDSAQTLHTDGGAGKHSPTKRHSLMRAQCSAEAQHLTNQQSERLAQQYCHMDEDYRKTLFGTLSAHRGSAATLNAMMGNTNAHASAQSKSARSSQKDEPVEESIENDEALIVNAAFDEIFAGYSGADDDEEERADKDVGIPFNNTDNALIAGSLKQISKDQLNNEGFRTRTQTSSYGCADSGPMNFSVLSRGAQKKIAPLPPNTIIVKNQNFPRTADAHLSATRSNMSTPMRKRAMLLQTEQKQSRSSSLHNFIERLKATHNKVKRPFNKLPSDSLLKQDHLNIERITQEVLHKHSPQLALYREIGEGEAADERNAHNDTFADSDFLRGSTLSQSFVVRQLNRPQSCDENKAGAKRKNQAPAPPPPPPTLKLATKSVVGVNAVNGAPRPNLGVQQQHQQQQRIKSTNELLLEDLAIQARRMRQQTTSRKYTAPAPPANKQQNTQTQVLRETNEDVEALQRFQPCRVSSRGNGVGADTSNAHIACSERGSFLRGTAEI